MRDQNVDAGRHGRWLYEQAPPLCLATELDEGAYYARAIQQTAFTYRRTV